MQNFVSTKRIQIYHRFIITVDELCTVQSLTIVLTIVSIFNDFLLVFIITCITIFVVNLKLCLLNYFKLLNISISTLYNIRVKDDVLLCNLDGAIIILFICLLYHNCKNNNSLID